MFRHALPSLHDIAIPPAMRSQLESEHRPSAPWLSEGDLAFGKITLLTGLWKMGNHSAFGLLAKMKAGGDSRASRLSIPDTDLAAIAPSC
jgi:hypothetical protein